MDIFTRTDGKQYHCVKRYAREVIERSRKLAVKKFGA